MIGKQNNLVNASAPAVIPSAQLIENPIEADARNQVVNRQFIYMNGLSGHVNSKKKKHTNTSSIIVGIIGSTIIVYIIYNLLNAL